MKKKTVIVGATLSLSILLGGCAPIDKGMEKADAFAQDKLSSIKVPFEWFKLDEKPKVNAITTWHKVKAMDLPTQDDSKSHLKTVDGLEKLLNSELTNQETIEQFLSNNKPASSSFKGFSLQMSSNDVMGKVIREIYQKPYQSIQSVTVTGVGKTFDGKEKPLVTISLNAINDSEKFLIYPLTLTLNERGQIDSVKQYKKPFNQLYTPSPLTEKSEWNESVHKEFKFVWKDFTGYPKAKDWQSVKQGDFTSWLSTNGLEETSKSGRAVYEWFKNNEGDLTKGSITSFLHTDENASAITKYELTYPKKKSLENHHVTISFDRGLNKIVDIEKGTYTESVSTKGEEQ